jgi:thymidine kinase
VLVRCGERAYRVVFPYDSKERVMANEDFVQIAEQEGYGSM